MMSVFTKTVIVPLLLRLTLAAIFIYHGWALVGGPDHRWGASWMKGPNAQPAPLQMTVAWGEFLGGIAMALGFLTRLAALGLLVIMAGAIATVHWKNGFSAQNGGFEYNFAIIMMCLCLILGGPGPLAVDRFVRLKRKKI